MKKNDLIDLKKLETTALEGKVSAAQKELQTLVIDKNIGKLKDLKAIHKKKIDIAQMLTVIKQKQLIANMEVKDAKQS